MRKNDAAARRTARTNGSLFACCLAVAALACAETNGSVPAPATAANAAGGVAGPPEIAWANMSKDQRIDYMKSAVLPRMKQAFTNFSPDRFGKMNCVTCHGDSAADGSFKMPNPKLPKLPATSEGLNA